MESVSGRTSRWAGQRERRRAEFVDAALAAIAEHGPQTSTEQIAAYVGVTRTKLYRHFTDAADLQRAVAQRASEMLNAELAPLWTPHGSMAQIIEASVGAHVRFLVDHRNLYRYLARCSLGEDAPDAIADIKLTIGTQLCQLFAVYLNAFGVDTDPQPLAFAIVGLVESSAGRWLDHPGQTSADGLVADLVRWIWLLVDDTLRAGGVHLDRDEPLATPDVIAADTQRYRMVGQ
ncbi:TetR/AcrR family transcriptional regulator [Mycolicibacterium brisbanense]|uniref:HTH-type transcriptional regulator n=1 Tax=Mycolicibacterium brisbanense TaxID=146020 RepID=A0A100W4M9_9MYCO|nr:TetR/AcrR family transcriptional regulator [Mycolicibacterium brisbanense]GAS91546.1 HTH-type transcriptional regulator [Mycolicibacterium brisbanense]